MVFLFCLLFNRRDHSSSRNPFFDLRSKKNPSAGRCLACYQGRRLAVTNVQPLVEESLMMKPLWATLGRWKPSRQPHATNHFLASSFFLWLMMQWLVVACDQRKGLCWKRSWRRNHPLDDSRFNRFIVSVSTLQELHHRPVFGMSRTSIFFLFPFLRCRVLGLSPLKD